MYLDKEGILKKLKSSDETSRSPLGEKWSRDQFFDFVSHNTVDETFNFPCTTVGGPMAGAPCSLPFVYPDCSVTFIHSLDFRYLIRLKLLMQLAKKSFHCNQNGSVLSKGYDQCVSSDKYEFGWCYTRTYLNDSSVLGKWGNCNTKCHVKLDQSIYNLASRAHEALWSESIFMLNYKYSGHCHTFDPVNSSYSGYRGQFYAMIGLTLTFILLM